MGFFVLGFQIEESSPLIPLNPYDRGSFFTKDYPHVWWGSVLISWSSLTIYVKMKRNIIIWFHASWVTSSTKQLCQHWFMELKLPVPLCQYLPISLQMSKDLWSCLLYIALCPLIPKLTTSIITCAILEVQTSRYHHPSIDVIDLG